MAHQPRTKMKSIPSASLPEREQRSHYLLRFLPLLLLMFYATASILKADPPCLPPQPSSNSVLVRRPADTCSRLISGGKIGSRSSRIKEGYLCCDRRHYRTDVCYMTGSMRTNPGSSSISLFGANTEMASEVLRPYTRKWESAVMKTIGEITLLPSSNLDQNRRCNVHHKGVPGIVFSAGGYTGNVYHEFNDGLIPLYITAERFRGEVVLLVTDYRSWWFSRYRSVLRWLSKYKVVDLAQDRRVHCFDEIIVGLKIHGELTIDPQLMHNGKGIRDFRALLDQAFSNPQLTPQRKSPIPAIHTHVRPSTGSNNNAARPKIAIFVRNKSRILQNLRHIIEVCHRIGFQVITLNPRRTTPLSEVYAALNSSDVMLAVHGAAMTHFLFMRPGSTLIQIVPLGLEWPAETYYGEPARKLGLNYMVYRVGPEESSLSKEYNRRDPVLVDPGSVTVKGWSETKKVYLDKQNVKVNLRRFSKLLEKGYSSSTSRQAY